MITRINKLLIEMRDVLKNNGIDEREARLLLAFAMGINVDELIRYTEVSDDVVRRLENLVDRRISGVPYAYITGTKEFMKLKFKVNESVLIPRPETEMIVEEALKQDISTVLDMCTGSGCIAISIAYYNKNAKVTAVDISEEALNIAKENAVLNGVKIDFIQSDLFQNVSDKFDLIVSNPPYIKTDVINNLDIDVKKEPHIALDGGESGLDFYERIAGQAKNYLNEEGILMFEIGYDQGNAVKQVLESNEYRNVQIKQDLSGKDRIIICSAN